MNVRPMMRITLWNAVVRVAGFAFVAFSSPLPHAQVSEGEVMHWGYAAFFGTGWYSIDGGGDVFSLMLKPRWRWREPELDENGTRILRMDLLGWPQESRDL